MMKTIIFLAIAVVVSARPQQFIDQFDEFGQARNFEFIPIVAESRSEPEGGAYDFSFQSANGILRSESGRPGANGATNQEGSWTVSYPDGSTGEFRFVADDLGARFESPLLPVGPAIPVHAQEQIARSEQERANGISHDGFWDPLRYGGPSSSNDNFVFIK